MKTPKARQRKPKTHLRHANRATEAICGNRSHKRGGGSPPLTEDITAVTCKRCLHLAGDKTHAGAGPTGVTYDITVVKTGNFFINAVRAVRQVTQWGLKESKEFCDSVRDGGQPQLLLSGLSREEAEDARRELLAAGVEVQLNSVRNGVADLTPILLVDRLTEVVHQMFKDHVCGEPVPQPRDIRPKLSLVLQTEGR